MKITTKRAVKSHAAAAATAVVLVWLAFWLIALATPPQRPDAGCEIINGFRCEVRPLSDEGDN